VGLLESSEVDQWNWRSWSWSGRGAKPAVVDTAEGGVTAGARVTFRSAGKPGGTVDVGASDSEMQGSPVELSVLGLVTASVMSWKGWRRC
jgi:hypothetical protein